MIEAMNLRSAALAWLGAFAATDMSRLQEEIHARSSIGTASDLKCYYRSDSSPTGDPCPQLILDGLVSSAANKVAVVHLYYGS